MQLNFELLLVKKPGYLVITKNFNQVLDQQNLVINGNLIISLRASYYFIKELAS